MNFGDNNDLLVNLSTYTKTTTSSVNGMPWNINLHKCFGDGELSPVPAHPAGVAAHLAGTQNN